MDNDGTYMFVHKNTSNYSFRLIKIEKQRITAHSNFHLYHKPGIKKLTKKIYFDYMKEMEYTVDQFLLFQDQFIKYVDGTAFQKYKL